MALVNLDEVKAYLDLTDDKLRTSGLRIYNYSETASTATVKLLANVLTLRFVSGSTETLTALTLTNASYDTLSELTAAILAISGQNWFAECYAPTDVASVDLVRVPETNCLGEARAVKIQVVNNNLLNKLIAQVGADVLGYIGMEIESASYSESYDGNDETTLVLDHRPIDNVTRLSIGSNGAFEVINEDTTATAAYVRIESSKLYLTIVGGSYAGTTELAFSTYLTITTLVNAINAIGKGWSAEVSGSDFGSYPTADLVAEEANFYCLDSSVLFEVFATAESDYVIYTDRGWICFDSGFPTGKKNILVEYTGGTATVPSDLKLATLELIAYQFYRTQRNFTLDSERLGDASWSARPNVETYEELRERRLSTFRKQYTIAV